jgi:Spy/CpxP family protein refolding chaperone
VRHTSAFVLLLLAFLSSPATARGADVPDGKWWKRPRLAEELGLTKEQQGQIEKIFVKSRTRLIDLKADLEKRQLALQEAMEDKSADRKDVERKIEAAENSRAELQKARVLMILDMKQVLKPEQWEKLVRRQQEMRERRGERRELMREQGRIPEDRPNRRRP